MYQLLKSLFSARLSRFALLICMVMTASYLYADDIGDVPPDRWSNYRKRHDYTPPPNTSDTNQENNGFTFWGVVIGVIMVGGGVFHLLAIDDLKMKWKMQRHILVYLSYAKRRARIAKSCADLIARHDANFSIEAMQNACNQTIQAFERYHKTGDTSEIAKVVIPEHRHLIENWCHSMIAWHPRRGKRFKKPHYIHIVNVVYSKNPASRAFYALFTIKEAQCVWDGRAGRYMYVPIWTHYNQEYWLFNFRDGRWAANLYCAPINRFMWQDDIVSGLPPGIAPSQAELRERIAREVPNHSFTKFVGRCWAWLWAKIGYPLPTPLLELPPMEKIAQSREEQKQLDRLAGELEKINQFWSRMRIIDNLERAYKTLHDSRPNIHPITQDSQLLTPRMLAQKHANSLHPETNNNLVISQVRLVLIRAPHGDEPGKASLRVRLKKQPDTQNPDQSPGADEIITQLFEMVLVDHDWLLDAIAPYPEEPAITGQDAKSAAVS